MTCVPGTALATPGVPQEHLFEAFVGVLRKDIAEADGKLVGDVPSRYASRAVK